MIKSELRFKTLNRIFQIVFFLVFSWLLVNVVGYYVVKGNFSPVIFFIPVTVLAVVAYKFILKLLPDSRGRQISIIFYVLMALMTVSLLIVGYFLMFEPTTDLYTVDTMSRSVASTGSMSQMYADLPKGRWQYISRYPNNQFIFVFLTVYYRIIFLIFGKIPLYAPILLNVLSIAFTVFLVYHTAKKMFNQQTALLAFLFCIFFVPFYTFTPYFYTDSLSMPYVMISLYLFIYALKCDKKIKSYVMLGLCALSIFVGYKLKGSVIIMLAVFVVFMLLKCNIKKAIICSAGGVAIILILSMCFSSLVLGLGVTTKEEMFEQQYPLTHWVMMGLKNPGGFDQEDSTFTYNAGNYNEKQAANIAEIKKRVANYGVTGMYSHITQKALYTWADGNYFATEHISETAIRPNALHEFINTDGKYHGIYLNYCNTFQLMLLLLMVVAAFLSIFKPRLDFSVVLKGIVLCVFIFFLIWETRSRYIFDFTPIFILIAAYGVKSIAEIKLKDIKNIFKKDKKIKSEN